MTPGATAFTSRTITAFVELLSIGTEQLEAAALAVEAGDLDQAVAQLRAAAEMAVQVWGGATRLAGSIDAERVTP